jgi:hypothetical protein
LWTEIISVLDFLVLRIEKKVLEKARVKQRECVCMREGNKSKFRKEENSLHRISGSNDNYCRKIEEFMARIQLYFCIHSSQNCSTLICKNERINKGL